MPFCLAPAALPAVTGVKKHKNPIYAALLAAATFFTSGVFASEESLAAMSGRVAESGPLQTQRLESDTMPDADVLRKISGSSYPGIVDCLLQRRVDAVSPEGMAASIHINYPSIGNSRVDADIREWVSELADAFASHVDFSLVNADNAMEQLEKTLDALNEGRLSETEESPPYELWGGYRISRPSGAALSIAFELWNYTGQPEGNLDIITLNYNLLTGQRLNFVDIFEKPDVALELMSHWSRKELEPRLGPMRRAHMLEAGTEPLVENFSSFTLTPDGICINFQPWQVAPSEAGVQKVTMPLEELMPSLPMLDLWGRG